MSTIVKTVIASLRIKLCDISHKIHRSLTASRSINTTEIHTNAVRKSSNKIIVLGSTAACRAPKRTSKTKAHAKDEL